ncbi:DNA polymerase I A, chloroplastic [Frankliniella fusca]|uniref:DNA polymerase I A, chloroplastic n=1 Tax=Frankliniella fusca TaxID=407009 RepID=A0AAE1L7N6_9NEOP|nr:DNA polymerase I A, chloroplastic [Frankliniella fusca]
MSRGGGGALRRYSTPPLRPPPCGWVGAPFRPAPSLPQPSPTELRFPAAGDAYHTYHLLLRVFSVMRVTLTMRRDSAVMSG